MTDIADPNTVGELSSAERFSDRLNPILVKEVRQAMRGRYFKISFWITLTVATLVGLGVLLVTIIEGGNEDVLGQAFFVAMFGCLVVAAQVFVPFSSFLSMGGEWDENTWDLLVLSNLKPRQIVYGKVFSSFVQSLLYFCTFGPFLVFAFLLRGVDLTALAVALSVSLFLSLLLSCVGVALSSFSRGKFARVIMMVLLVVILLWIAGMTMVWAGQMMFFPMQLREPEMLAAISASLSVIVAVAAFFFAATCARLAHPEENRSSGLRVTALGIVVCGLGWVTYIMGTRIERDILIGMSCAAFAVLMVSSIFFATEPERLGRRVVATLPRNRLLALLATPFLPGGARGLLFFLTGGLMITAWMFIYPNLADPSFEFRRGQPWIPFALLGYGLAFLGLPSGIFSRLSDKIGFRIMARLSVLILFVGAIMLPPLIGFLLQIESWETFEHPGNVFIVVDHLFDNPMEELNSMMLVVLVVLLAIAVNVPRLWRQFVELKAASAERLNTES